MRMLRFAVPSILLFACAPSAPTAYPDVIMWGAERQRCIQENDASAAARACVEAVDARYPSVSGDDAGKGKVTP